jgi:hypothetical protein
LGKWNYVYFPLDTIEVGGEPFHTVISGWDNVVCNKSHSRKPFLERNQKDTEPTAAFFYGFWIISQTGIGVIYDVADWCAIAAVDAKNNLTGQVIKGFSNNKPLYTSFSEIWKADGEPYYMVQPAMDKEIALKAIKSVNVFAYGGHGDGGSMWFLKDLNSPPQRLAIDEIPQNSLHLVVIGSCRGPLAEWSPFTLVEYFVNKRGAKCGVGVGGKYPGEWYGGENLRGWKILFTEAWATWCKHFWKLAAKGEEDGKTYYTVHKAAELAMIKANSETPFRRGLKIFGDFAKVEIKTFGKDVYLGQIE